MDLKELKKLINEEVKRAKQINLLKEQGDEQKTSNIHARNVQASRAATGKLSGGEEPTQAIPGISIDPSAKTVLKKDKQSATQPENQNPEQFYKGILRLYNAITDKIYFELKNEEVHQIIQDITSREIEKLRAKYPELDIGSKLG